MAGKPKPMSQIKQLLRLHKQGNSKKTIARSLGISKNTVKTYLLKLSTSNWKIEELLKLDDPVLEGKFHPGNPSYKDSRYKGLKDDLDYYVRELKRIGVTRRLLWEEYRDKTDDGYGYSQFCYHLSQYIQASKPSMVLHHEAGDKLFIDFAGKKLSYVDPDTGEVIQCPVFVACLPYSDYCFAMAVRTQNVDDFIYALICCLQALGGVPKALVPDNLKAAITKANRYDPHINQALEDFANHYQTNVFPARVGKPKDKALVENQVKLVYSRVFARLRNQQFFSLSSLNAAIQDKVHQLNQTRLQQKPWCREERFLAEEKPLLAPLPQQAFELKYYKQLTVAKNNHIYMTQDKHYYSVPYTYIGTKVKVIFTRSLVRIYTGGKQIAVHLRSPQKNGYSTTREHLCSQHQHYLDRSPKYYINRAKSKSDNLAMLFQLIFEQDRYPEQLYRTCDGLLRLQNKTDPQTFNKACDLAVEHQNYSYRFMVNLLENKMIGQGALQKEKPLPRHNNIRGKDYYHQLKLNFKDYGN